MAPASIRIGCAGWALRKESAETFPPAATHLARYAQRLDAVEINSSFYRPHRRSTFERWAASVPAAFRFAVKMPRSVTHTARLIGVDDKLDSFLEAVSGLGTKLGPLLIQLPPSLAFDKSAAGTFFEALRHRFPGAVVCEPRHATWFDRAPSALLRRYEIGRVSADPAPVPGAEEPAGYGGICYYRLHGAPRRYYSAYAGEALRRLAERMHKDAARGLQSWCIFDNTALGAALDNALELRAMVDGA